MCIDPIESHTVLDCENSVRLSDYACGIFESLPSRKSVKKAIKRGELLVNGRSSETGHWVKRGEVLSVIAQAATLPVYRRKLNCVFQDQYFAVVVKPADLPVSGFQVRNLQNALAQNLEPSSEVDELRPPRPVHRLDRLTGGLIVIAKTLSSAAHLGRQFERREVEKSYVAIVSGPLKEELHLSQPIDDREAFTAVSPVGRLKHQKHGELTLVMAYPKTGRRNQIRVHLSNAGLPVLGDKKFGGIHAGRGLFLFSQAITFKHPKSEIRLHFELELPGKFKRYFPEGDKIIAASHNHTD